MTTRRSYIVYFANSNSETPIWSLSVNDLELVAGMLAASLGIMSDLNDERKDTFYYVDSDTDVSEFRLLDNIPETSITNNTCGILSQGQYGLWMHSGQRFNYSLYGFRRPAFFQGIISICHSFGVDFRNYIFGMPFDGNGNQYSLSDYVMVSYQIGQDAPDLTDIEQEEEDDENVIDPWADEDENYYEPPDLTAH